MKKLIVFLLAVTLVLGLAACGGGSGGGGTSSKYSRANPAKVNETVVYDCMSDQDYAFKLEITMLEVVRGGSALKMAMQASNYNDVPPEGKEYLFAKFKLNALDSKNDAPIDAEYMFGLVKSDGSVYDPGNTYTYVSDMQAIQTMYKGSSQEGYIFFLVDADDTNPTIVFPTYKTSQVWFSSEPTANNEADTGYNPLGDPNRLGSKDNPAQLGETASFKGVEMPRSYYFYDVDITLTELNRGQRAMDMVTLADKSNDTPPVGKEYLIAKVKVDAIASKDNSAIDISDYYFTLFSSGGIEYTDHAYVYNLENKGLSQMYPGASQEGYLVFIVDKNDDNPYIVFASDSSAPVWISAADCNTEPLIDQNAPGTINSPVPLNQSLACNVDDYSGKYKVQMKILDYDRGYISDSDKMKYGIDHSDLAPGMELLVLLLQVDAIESEGNSKISISDYDFDLVSGTGIKYDKVYAYGNYTKLQDMYPGASQTGVLFFAVSIADDNPLLLFNDEFWFSFNEDSGAISGGATSATL